jgi:DeoR family transcriptional regulator, glycerol-3-phosphate regulon repressor
MQQNQTKTNKISSRHTEILRLLRQNGTMAVADLAAFLSVSEETIRRDAVPLEQRGDITKMHGALSVPQHFGEAPFEKRMREQAPGKLAIARAAVELIKDGDSLIIDTGSTTHFFARELRARRNLTVITNSTEIARTLASVRGNTIYLAGGEMQADDGAAYGPTAVDFVSRFKVQHAILSISALDPVVGAMDATLNEAEYGAMAISRATHRFILADATKFGITALVKVCDYQDIHTIVTDEPPSDKFKSVLMNAGTKLVIAPQ